MGIEPAPVEALTSLEARFVGGWELMLWTSFRSDGAAYYPFGRDCIGQILYSADRRMSCHLMRAARPPLGRGLYEVDDATLGAAMPAYSGYFGRWSVDAAAGEIVHHVLGAWDPGWLGLDQARRFRFDADRLTLEADAGGESARLEWRRVGPAAARAAFMEGPLLCN